MKKQFFQHKKFAPAILSALIAVSFSASTALANPADCHPSNPSNEYRHMINDDRPHDDKRIHHKQFNRGHIAGYLAKTFSLDQQVVQSYADDGWRFRDLYQGALIAKVSGNNLDTVLDAKSDQKSWRDVAASFNVTKAQLKDARFDIRATHMADRLDMNKYTVKTLLKDGYQPRDIVMANAISKKGNKPILQVLSMRKINNTWQDVAKEVGLSPREMKSIFPHHDGKHIPPKHHR